MILTVYPGGPLRGEVSLPGDKSLSHRAALFAAMADGVSTIDHFLVSGVTRAMLGALAELSVRWEITGDNRLTVWGTGWKNLLPPSDALQCGNSATTLRLLTGALAASGIPAILDGTPGLRSRPMGRIVAPLRAMGAPIEAGPGQCAPLVLSARPADQPLKSIQYRLPVASAQVKSCLLLAALAADGPVTLTEPSLSRDHTERMLSSMGVSISTPSFGPDGSATVTLTPPAGPLAPLSLALPGDFSSAAFLIAAALIAPGSDVLIREAGLNPTRTGLLEALRSMGADIRIETSGERSGEPVGDLRVRYSPLRGTRVTGDLGVRMIDEFPVFAVAASFAAGRTEVCGVEELRHKESDRISAVGHELANLGVTATETVDGFAIHGGQTVRGGTVQAHGDHRLAMSLALAGLAAGQPVVVPGAEIISESFPEFVSVLSCLGAQIRLEAGPC